MTPLSKATSSSSFLMLSALCLCSLWAGCGDEESSLSTKDTPAVTLSASSIEIILPEKENIAKTVETILFIQSTGKVDLTVKEIKWLGEKPTRVFMSNGSTEDVAKEACSSEVYFVQSKLCVSTGAPMTPLVVAPGVDRQIPLYISAFGDSEVNAIKCPEVPAGVPQAFRERYCGAIQIVTDASNDLEGIVVGGVATVYFQADRTQGNLVYSKPSLSYENVKPGYDEVQTFSITNTSSEPVTVQQIAPTGSEAEISIEGLDPLPLKLETNDTKQFDVRLKIPISYTKADLDKISDNAALALRIISTAPGSPKDIPISIDTNLSVPSIPLIDKERLEFAGDMDIQSFTITNPGSQTMRVTGLRFEPDLSAAYDVFFDDNGTEKSLRTTPLLIQSLRDGEPERNKKTVQVRYKAQAQGSGLTSVVISYAYSVGNLEERGDVRITLMGDQKNVPFGTLSSNSFTFSNLATMDQTYRALLTNRGTATLNVTDAQIVPLKQGDPTEELSLLVDGATADTFSVAAGQTKELAVRFIVADSENDQIGVTLKSDTAGPTLGFQVNSIKAELPVDAIAFTSSFSTETMAGSSPDAIALKDAATVGKLATLEFGAGVDGAVTTSARWILYEKPAGSMVSVDTKAPKVALVPDLSGTYKILTSATFKNFTLQKILEFRVEEPTK